MPFDAQSEYKLPITPEDNRFGDIEAALNNPILRQGGSISYSRPGISSPAIRTVSDKLQDRADLSDWAGLDATGNNASTSTLQRALNDLQGTGVRLYIPPGNYTLDAPINLGLQATLEGSNWPAEFNAQKSTWFLLAHTGRGFFSEAGSGSMNLSRFGTHRQQPAIVSGWQPTPAEADIWLQGDDIHIEEVTNANAYRGIVLSGTAGGQGSGRLSIDKWRGQCFYEALKIVSAYDVNRISNWHQWPFWSQNPVVRAWTYANLTSITSLRNDNPTFYGCFSIWHNVGVRFGRFAGDPGNGNRPGGVTSKAKFATCDFDIGTDAVVVDADAGGTTADFTQFSAQGRDDSNAVNSGGIVVRSTTGSTLRFSQADIKHMGANLVRIEGSGNRVSITDLSTGDFNKTGLGFPALEVYAGNTLEINGDVVASKPLTYGGGGQSNIRSPEWRSWNPGLATATRARYQRLNNTIKYSIRIVNAPAGQPVRFAFPVKPLNNVNNTCVGYGRELSSHGKGLTVTSIAGTALADILAVDNTNPGGANTVLEVSGEYEV